MSPKEQGLHICEQYSNDGNTCDLYAVKKVLLFRVKKHLKITFLIDNVFALTNCDAMR